MLISTVETSPNIALIKYWGKSDDLLKIALNDSISMTLSQDALRTKTTIALVDGLKKDAVFFSGKKVRDEKVEEWIKLSRKRLSKKYPDVKKRMLIITENDFPTSAGIASSASGFAALSAALCSALGITSKKEMSIIARFGSGSASRSIEGGIVKWKNPKGADSDESYAVQVVPKKHWPDLVDIICICDSKKKKVSSKQGMEATVRTSSCFGCRVPKANARVKIVEKAVKKRDFETMAIETMKDSNSMHATCLDTWPPVFYMNDVSKEIVYAIHEFNSEGIGAAYTFDAGPNAHIITTKKHVSDIRKMLKKIDGVEKIIVSPIGEGARFLRPDRKEVERYLKRLK